LLAATSFSLEGYKAYGKDCVDTLEKHFPGRIVVYTEGEIPNHPKAEIREFFAIDGVVEYLERIKSHPGSDGVNGGQYDFRYDANKFCRKVFAQDAVFDEDQYVFWFDADCVVKKELPAELLTSLVSEYAVAYMGRKQSYTETGWLGFNTRHPDFPAFRSKYLSYFTSGRIFSQLKGWHDCIAFDYAREGLTGLNMTPNGHGFGQVIGESPLAGYVAHLKGARKFSDKHKRDAFKV
jgi:hypothetical protein